VQIHLRAGALRVRYGNSFAALRIAVAVMRRYTDAPQLSSMQ
jgi:hypothetical protein